ncbi:MAG: tripartite tricarboxylate transporter substrate binding protein [Hyphomonadaceae bacterium]|nr:tripartite tricarboxylate transporter substrate binding protein [Hyphomonadaceae bacterium]
MTSRISRRTLIKTGIASAAAMPLSAPAQAQAWPTKPIRIVCGYPAGGLTDLFARAYGEHLAQTLGQPVVVENKPGAGGSIAAQLVKTSPADGYTLMFTISTTMFGNRVLYKSLPYDPDKDFVLISSMSAGHLPFVASKATGATNLAEFIAYARKNKVSVGTYAAGSYAHIAVAELNKLYGLQMEAVHYRGEAPMWQDMAAGVIQAASGSYAAAANVLQSGAGRPIAVPGTKRMGKLPDVLTFLEQGVTAKSFQLQGFIGLMGPAAVPKEIVQRVSDLMVEGGKTERVRKLLDTFGIDDSAVGHEAFRKLYDEEGPIWISLVQGLGLTPE